MKFGKTYAETIANPSFPAEWKGKAIEYRKLKKVINRVAVELAELGLTAEVLKELLARRGEEDGEKNISGAVITETSANEDEKGAEVQVKIQEAGEDENVFNAENLKEEPIISTIFATVKPKAGKRVARASYEMSGTSESPQPRIRIVFDSASSNSEDYSGDSDDGPHSHQISRESSNNTDDTDFSAKSFSPPSSPSPKIVEIDSSDSEGGRGAGLKRLPSSDSANSHSSDDGSQKLFEGAGPKEMSLLKRMYGIHVPIGHRESGESDEEHEKTQKWLGLIPGETEDFEFDLPKARRRKSDETVRWVEGSLQNCEVGHCHGPKCFEAPPKAPPLERLGSNGSSISLDDGAVADVEDEDGDVETEEDEIRKPIPPPKKRRHHHRQHRREVFIPLSIDSEFLTLLSQALNSLAVLQAAQKSTFAQSVRALASEVSLVSSPSRPKTDLYIWREIFALWVQAQIFESEREKDRGERSVGDAEIKLDWFVDQVAVQGLAKKMRHKESRIALERFIKLNVELLDMKRFQMANEEAARKILKKHDKRTALTASLGFPQFIAGTSAMGEFSSTANISRALHLPGFPSLPHILLATFTDTLLPIIPSLEDYECAICGDVAFKPIRLECGHKFCVRCLVKMQKRGQDACPQCRSAVVLRANGSNLDQALQEYLKLWFPKEVKAKEKANGKESAQEELMEMGMVSDHRCTLQ